MNQNETVLATAQRLQQGGVPYALVTVIRALAPASARPGDKAVVTGDGEMNGWVGGGCSQPIVVRTVRAALADGCARMVRIAPSESNSEGQLGDVLEFGMSCHSGGTLELFVDPMLPSAQLVVIGSSPVAIALCGLAPRVGFEVSVVAHEADTSGFADAKQVYTDDRSQTVQPHVAPGAWVVVATQGRRDMQALDLALKLDARQVSFVASATKAQVLRDALIASGNDASAVNAIVAPAGYPISARTPEEIALSVLAAIVADRRRLTTDAGAVAPALEARRGAAKPAAAAVPRIEAATVVDAPPHSCCSDGGG
jgi:xanthine dehydrogenase accessory factor